LTEGSLTVVSYVCIMSTAINKISRALQGWTFKCMVPADISGELGSHIIRLKGKRTVTLTAAAAIHSMIPSSSVIAFLPSILQCIDKPIAPRTSVEHLCSPGVRQHSGFTSLSLQVGHLQCLICRLSEGMHTWCPWWPNGPLPAEPTHALCPTNAPTKTRAGFAW